MLGGWPPAFNETMSSAGVLSWNAIADASGYRVYAFRQGATFPVSYPNHRSVWAGAFINNAPSDSPNFGGSDRTTLSTHTPALYLTVEDFTFTSNTHVMTMIADAYIELPANVTEVNVNAIPGLTDGETYVFRIQAMAAPLGTPVTAPTPIGSVPWDDSRLSGVTQHPTRGNIVQSVYFPAFTIDTSTIPTTWTVTFALGGGVLDSGVLVQTINDGADAVPPTVSRPNHTFDRWDPVGSYNNVTGNRTITALWTPETVNLPPVTSLQFEQLPNGEVRFTWDAPVPIDDVTGYRIEFTTAADWETPGAISSVTVPNLAAAPGVMSAIAQASGSVITPGVYSFRVISVGDGGAESAPAVLTSTLTIAEIGVPVEVDYVTWGLANSVISVFGPFTVNQSLIVSYWVMGVEASRTTVFGQTVALVPDGARFVFYEPPGFRDNIFDFSSDGQVFVWEQTQMETVGGGDIVVTITPRQMVLIDL